MLITLCLLVYYRHCRWSNTWHGITGHYECLGVYSGLKNNVLQIGHRRWFSAHLWYTDTFNLKKTTVDEASAKKMNLWWSMLREVWEGRQSTDYYNGRKGELVAMEKPMFKKISVNT